MLIFIPLFMTTSTNKTLSKSVVPVHYNLLIDTNTELNTFKGYVNIECRVESETNIVVLNVDNLTILQTKIYKNETENESEIEYKHSYDLQDQTIIFKTDLLLHETFNIIIIFEGKISTKLSGYYMSTYANKTKQMYSTHFEPTSARNAFPCFDQPDMKAVFKISLLIPDNFVALSNSTIDQEISNLNLNENNLSNFDELSMELIKSSNNHKLVTFNDTVKMSTYLVAYAIGDLHFIEQTTTKNLKIRIYAPRGEEHRGHFALATSILCLEFFENYFNIKYPLKKLDHIAIPDFAMGAMENWGLITYRKASLLMDSKSPTQTKKVIAETVCHELAHQWFGNLATMKWWNDIWLNEGFATWAAALGIEHINNLNRPSNQSEENNSLNENNDDKNINDNKNINDINNPVINNIYDNKPVIDNWDIWSSFINNDVEYGMSYDALHSTHEIMVNVTDPDEIDQIFDGISYSKGAALIKMLEDYVSPEIFKNALRKYLHSFQYKNATTENLWENVESVSGKEIKGMIDYWTRYKGFPLVRVKSVGEKLILTQERFYLIKDYKKENLTTDENKNMNVNQNVNENLSRDDVENPDLKIENENPDLKIENRKKAKVSSNWLIPLRIKFYNSDLTPINDTNNITIFSTDTIEIPKTSDLFKINDESNGFYRVLYDDITIPLQLLKAPNISVRNKLNIINDLFQLSIGSYISLTIPILASISILKNESNYDLISAGLTGIAEIKSIFYNNESKRNELTRISQEILNNRAYNINLKNAGNNINEESFNCAIMSAAVGNNDNKILEQMNKVYEEYKRDETAIHPNFISAMFISVVKTENVDKFNEIWEMYLKETRDEIKNITLSALGATQTKTEFLMEQIFEDNVKLQDKIYIFASLCGNLKKRDNIIDYTLNNFEKIVNMFDKHASLLGYVIEKVIGSICDNERRNKAIDVIRKTNMKAVMRAVDKALEKSAIKIRFRENNKDIVFNKE